jgi:hypothetical protein
MTRAEFIQRALLASIAQRAFDPYVDVVQAAVLLADAIERSNVAPWSDPAAGLADFVSRVENEAHRRGYLLGKGDAEKENHEAVLELERVRKLNQDICHDREMMRAAHATKLLEEREVEREACASIADERCRVGGDACGVAREIRARSGGLPVGIIVP